MSRMRVALPWFLLPIPSAAGSSPFPGLHAARRQALPNREPSEHFSAVQWATEWTASGHGACRETE